MHVMRYSKDYQYSESEDQEEQKGERDEQSYKEEWTDSNPASVELKVPDQTNQVITD